MIYNATIEEQRDKVLNYLNQNQYTRVLDCGGAMNPWASKHVNYYFDILNPQEYLKGGHLDTEKLRSARIFVGDINDGYGWDEIYRYVSEHGKFDFAICTQTLEDIRNPSYILRSLPTIAEQGFISVPHKYRELNYVEGYDPIAQKEWGLNKPYIGYSHHRWIFTIIEGPKLRLFPKLEFISCVIGIQELIKGKPIENELSFWWKDDIPFEIINGDFLGPNPPTVFSLYANMLREGL